MSTPADTGAGGGTGIGVGPGTSAQQSSITQAVKNVAGAAGGGGLSPNAMADYQGSNIPQAGGSAGSFPVYNMPTTGGNTKNPSVYMGTAAQSPYLYLNYSDAVNMYYQWDAKTKDKFLSQLSLAGYDTNKLMDDQIQKLWAGYVTTAASYQAAGTRISPWDVLSKDMAQRASENATPQTVTQTQTRYNISTAEEASALFQGAAQTLLGRDPTQSEQARFKSVLNQYERAHPTTMTTQTEYVGGNIKSSKTKDIEGGVTAGAQQYIAQQEAKKNPEYGAYQAATSGMNWLLEMVKGT